MSEKKKQEYTTGGLKNRQDVENALASAEYRPSQEVTDAASDLKQWQANRPGDYESAYQGRIDGLMENLLDRKEFSYSYGADPLYRQYAQLYTQNAQNASADAAAQAAALTGGYGSSYAASAARQAYQQQIGALSEAIPTLYRLALDTYQSGGDALVEQIDQLNGQEQNAQQKYERELADYYTQLEQKGNAYNTAYTQDYGRYQDYLGQLDSLYGYYAAQEQQEAARRQQGFNNVMTVLGLLGDAAQLAITGTTGLGSMAGSLLNTGYNIYAGNRAYEAERADTAWKQKMQEQLRQDELAQQQYKNEQAQQEYQDKLRQQQVSNALAAERLDLSKSQWAAKQEKASRTAEKASADAAAKRGSLTGDTGLKVGKSGVSSGGTVPYSAARMRSQGRSDTAIRTQCEKLRTLIDDLNLTSKLEYGAQPLRRKDLRAGPLFRQLVAQFCESPLAEHCEITLEQEEPAEQTVLSVDEALLARLLENLLNNSVRHNSKPVNITVHTRLAGERFCLTVADDGIGYPPAVLAALNAAEPAENAPHILGLYVVQQIAAAHGGRAVFGQNTPHGAKAMVYLPLG